MTPVETVPAMLARAEETGAPTDLLVRVAEAYIAKMGQAAAEVEAGAHLDGRASIYTGETYAQARDRWTAYRDALLASVDGPCCYGYHTSANREHERGCPAA